jgi:hypothetical protein
MGKAKSKAAGKASGAAAPREQAAGAPRRRAAVRAAVRAWLTEARWRLLEIEATAKQMVEEATGNPDGDLAAVLAGPLSELEDMATHLGNADSCAASLRVTNDAEPLPNPVLVAKGFLKFGVREGE